MQESNVQRPNVQQPNRQAPTRVSGARTRLGVHVLLLLALSVLLQWHNAQPALSTESPEHGKPGEHHENGEAQIALHKSVEVFPGTPMGDSEGDAEEAGIAEGDTFSPPVDRTTLVTYTLRLEHTGDAERIRAQLVDELPPGVIATGGVLVTLEQGAADPLEVRVHPKRVSWRGTLGEDAILRIEFGAWVQRCTARPHHELKNTAIAWADGGPHVKASAEFRVPCPNDDDDHDDDNGDNDDNDDEEGPDVVVHKRGELERVLNPETNEVEARIKWTVTYANLGDETATDVVIEDRFDGLNINEYLIDVILPEGVEASREGDVVRFTIPEVPTGERFRIGILTQIPPLANVEDANVVNVAGARVEADVNTDNNLDRARVHIATETPTITSPVDGVTCANEIEVRGTAAPGATVVVLVNDERQATTEANDRGRWRVQLTLPDGAHTLQAASTLGPLSSLPSEPVEIRVDSSLLWDPMSLTFTGPNGSRQMAANPDGFATVDGWSVRLRPDTRYSVSVRICCDDPETAQVALRMEGSDPLVLAHQGEGIFSGEFTTPAVAESTRIQVQLVVRCGDAEGAGNGTLGILASQAVVVDRFSGAPIEGATVTLLRIQRGRTSAHNGNGNGNRIWDGEPFGQENPQTTGPDGAYSFAPPPGLYQLVVTKPGYQRFRTGVIRVNDAPIQEKIELTPRFGERPPIHVFLLGKFEKGLGVILIKPGGLIKWENSDTVNHAITVIFESLGLAEAEAGAQSQHVWESGVIAPGESYELSLESQGRYTVYSSLDPDPIAEIEVTEDADNPDTLNQFPLFAPFLSTDD